MVMAPRCEHTSIGGDCSYSYSTFLCVREALYLQNVQPIGLGRVARGSAVVQVDHVILCRVFVLREGVILVGKEPHAQVQDMILLQ